MRTFYIILFFVLYLLSGNAQEITIYGGRSLWHADNLCDVEFTGCDWRQLNQGSMLGYAYHPSGELWLVLADTEFDYNSIRIFKVDNNTCEYNLLFTIPLPFYWNCVNAVNIDYLGRIYLNINEYDSLTNIKIKTLSRISNPAQPVFERLFEYFPNQNIFEVHFSKNRIYIPEIQFPRIYIFDTSFQLLNTILMDKHIWGLTSFSFGCDSVKTYATHMSISTQEYIASGPDSIMYISEYNLETNMLTPVCSYHMGDKVANTQLTSPLEFLSSDPECDLLIDLDRDNSTGVYPYNYFDSTSYCTTVEALICDPDVYIHTSASLDSIVLIVSGMHEFGDEHLIPSGLPPGSTFTQRNDSTYVLTSSNSTDSIYQEALRAIRYQHVGSQRTPGERRIIVQGFNAFKDGIKVTATIHISGLVFAGDDITLLICTDTLIQDMSAMTGGQPGGYWTPSLMLGGHIFNSMLDHASSYRYVIIDPTCGNDTAIVTINRDVSAPVDLLGEDQALCQDDTIDIAISQPAQSIFWDNGSSNPIREITDSGTYWILVETSGGCIYSDSLIITEGVEWMPSLEMKDPVCDLSNGEIMVDPNEFTENTSIIVNGVLLSAPTMSALAQGAYEIIATSNDGCSTTSTVTLTEQPILDIAIDSQSIITKGVWKQVAYLEQNNIVVENIIFDPSTSIRWTGSAIEVYGERDIQYEITFIDQNGCTDTHFLTVLVEEEQGIYIPNIFSPGSTAGNDVWQASISETYTLDVLRVYDRWGSMVHQTITDALWDGTRDGQECSSGVYVYQMILSNQGSNERKVMMGDITLIR